MSTGGGIAVLMLLGGAGIVVGLVAMVLDLNIASEPGFLPVTMSASTGAAAGLVYYAVRTGNPGFFVGLIFYLGPYAMFMSFAGWRMYKIVKAELEQRRVGRLPYEAALKAERKRDLSLAVELYEEYARAFPEEAGALGHWARCLGKLSRHMEAVEVLRRLFDMERGKKQVSVGLEIVYVLYAKAGRKTEAREEVARLKRRYFNTPLEEVLDAKLEELTVRITGDPRPYEKRIGLTPQSKGGEAWDELRR